MDHPAYRITHIYLDRYKAPPLSAIDKLTGNYLVFWWKNIALGHLFLQPGEQLSEKTYYARLIEAIEPAIQMYGSRGSKEQLHWQQLFLNKDLESLSVWAESILTPWTLIDIPVTVPVTVIICTRNRAAYLRQCLQQLYKLRCLPEEIIVVDNAPADSSTYNIASEFEKVTYIKEPTPGLDIARNTGIQNSQHAVVAFLDDDVTVHPMWVYWVWQTFLDPTIAAMTGLVIATELQTKAQVNFEKYWSFNRGYVDKTYTRDFFNSTLPIGPPVWEIGAGANMAFRKSVFNDVGLFNELLDVGAAGCNGDSEMWYRILANGHSIRYNPRAIVFHEHRRETAGLKKQLYYYMRGFTVAALLQQQQHQKAGYKRHLFQVLPQFYAGLIRSGFPRYRARTSTIWSEIKGMVSGLIFYKKNRRRLLKSIGR